MPGFILSRDRDAWATIRGYVYQVNLTILRWLDLQPGQILELERGEDIDLVARSLTSLDEEQERLLEQIKHRDRSITLRSPEAVSAIANAIDHRDENPDIPLHFRYLTNAAVGQEVRSPLPDAGISIWEQVRTGTLGAIPLEFALEGIRELLNSAAQPDGVPEEIWLLYRRYATEARADQLLDLISHFQWSTGTPEIPELQQDVLRVLVFRYGASDDRRATEQYHRLFARVFDQLSQPGIKRLTVQDRDLELSLPLLSDQDRGRLDTITAVVAAVQVRVEGLEQEVQQHSQLITSLDVRMAALASQSGVAADLSLTRADLDLDIPLLGQLISPRLSTVASTITVLTDYTWLAIHGTTASGKTQLAALIANSLGTCRAWVRLTGLTVPQTCLRLETAIAELTGSPLVGNRRTWYEQFAKRLGAGTLLALDDLSRLETGGELTERLLLLAEVCEAHGLKLLSTSAYPLPASVQNLLGQQVFVMEAPTFTDEEVRDLLMAYEAPEASLRVRKSITSRDMVY